MTCKECKKHAHETACFSNSPTNPWPCPSNGDYDFIELCPRHSMLERLADLLRALHDRVQIFSADEIPKTCGACGTPFASCDTDCAAAASMSNQNYLVGRAAKLLAEYDQLSTSSAKEGNR